ncbi:hypothetical protein ACFQU1_03030 [Chelatococcus sp. GCM10030263]
MRSLILALTLVASTAFATAAFADCGPKHTSSIQDQTSAKTSEA